jgi:hypothetical protein
LIVVTNKIKLKGSLEYVWICRAEIILTVNYICSMFKRVRVKSERQPQQLCLEKHGLNILGLNCCMVKYVNVWGRNWSNRYEYSLLISSGINYHNKNFRYFSFCVADPDPSHTNTETLVQIPTKIREEWPGPVWSGSWSAILFFFLSRSPINLCKCLLFLTS